MRIRVPKIRTVFSLATLLLAGFACAAHGAVLVVDEVRYNDPEGARVPIRLIAGTDERVAALQFDLRFPADGLVPQATPASPGTAARAADKSVSAATTKTGTVRVIVAGLNQNVIADGEVAVVHFRVLERLRQTPPTLKLEHVLVSDPRGNAIRVTQGPESSGQSAAGTLSENAPNQSNHPWRYSAAFLVAALAVFAGWRFRSLRQPRNRQGSRT